MTILPDKALEDIEDAIFIPINASIIIEDGRLYAYYGKGLEQSVSKEFPPEVLENLTYLLANPELWITFFDSLEVSLNGG